MLSNKWIHPCSLSWCRKSCCWVTSLLRLNTARSSLYSPICPGILTLLLLVDIVGADEEEDVAEDVAEEEGFSIFVGEFSFIALAYNGWRRWGGDLIATCGDDLLCVLDLDDDDDEFDDVCDDVDLSLEKFRRIRRILLPSDFLSVGFWFFSTRNPLVFPVSQNPPEERNMPLVNTSSANKKFYGISSPRSSQRFSFLCLSLKL